MKLITHLLLIPRLQHSQQDLTSWLVGVMNITNTNTQFYPFIPFVTNILEDYSDVLTYLFTYLITYLLIYLLGLFPCAY
jgi:hypothetical protein